MESLVTGSSSTARVPLEPHPPCGLTLGIERRIEVVGSASSGLEAVALAEALRPDVVLDGPPHAEHGRHRGNPARAKVSPASRVVIVTAARVREVAAQALAAGAERCLTKDTPALKLIDAILEFPHRATVIPLVPREARIA